MSIFVIVLNIIDLFLSVGGNVPGFGAIADCASVIINIILGDILGVILSLISIIPIVGNVSGIMKVIYRLIAVIKFFT